MARKAQTQPDDAYTSHAAAADDLSAPPLLQETPMGDATEHGAPLVDAPPPPQYRVVRSQYVMVRGGRTILREGKVIDERNYDLPALISQGVTLERVS